MPVLTKHWLLRAGRRRVDRDIFECHILCPCLRHPCFGRFGQITLKNDPRARAVKAVDGSRDAVRFGFSRKRREAADPPAAISARVAQSYVECEADGG